MDGSYKHVSLRVYWELGKSTLVDQGRDHEQDFRDFAETVVSNLRSQVSVGTTTTASVPGESRDISFSAARPVAQADWVKAITDAARSCRVLSDQASWSMD
jgi:phenylalanyl-tRNA synthetase beta subunit